MRPALCFALLALIVPLAAGCRPTAEENVEVQAEKASRSLEERYNQLSAEAGNEADAAAAPYDREADALLNRMGGNQAVAENAAAPAGARRR